MRRHVRLGVGAGMLMSLLVTGVAFAADPLDAELDLDTDAIVVIDVSDDDANARAKAKVRARADATSDIDSTRAVNADADVNVDVVGDLEAFDGTTADANAEADVNLDLDLTGSDDQDNLVTDADADVDAAATIGWLEDDEPLADAILDAGTDTTGAAQLFESAVFDSDTDVCARLAVFGNAGGCGSDAAPGGNGGGDGGDPLADAVLDASTDTTGSAQLVESAAVDSETDVCARLALFGRAGGCGTAAAPGGNGGDDGGNPAPGGSPGGDDEGTAPATAVNDDPIAGGSLPDTALPINPASAPWLLLLLVGLHAAVRWGLPMKR